MRPAPAVARVPDDVFAGLPREGGALWWHEGRGLWGTGRAHEVHVGRGPGRGMRAWADLQESFAGIAADEGPAPVAFGSFTFDVESDRSVLFVPATTHYADERGTFVRRLGDDAGDATGGGGGEDRMDRPRFAGASVDEVRWLDEVGAAIAAIRAGEMEKVVLARDEILWSRSPFDQAAIARRLATVFPGCYTFVCDGLVGATPELLVRKSSSAVESLVLAGSARRGAEAEEDRAVGRALLDSAKDRHEHELAVSSVVSALETVCAGVSADPVPHLLRLANVQHLATRVTGEVTSPDTTVLHVVDALHPTAAVGGVPRAAALDRIRAAEGDLRGRYAGPVGWVDARGDGEWGIALRCAAVFGPRAQLFAGAGIMANSLPEAELEETRLKLRAMEGALGLEV